MLRSFVWYISTCLVVLVLLAGCKKAQVEPYDTYHDGWGMNGVIDGDSFKAVTFRISKEAINFGVNIYEVRPNGVEEIVWAFDRGRGLESSNLYQVQENEKTFSVTVVSNGSPLEISNMRLEFN